MFDIFFPLLQFQLSNVGLCIKTNEASNLTAFFNAMKKQAFAQNLG